MTKQRTRQRRIKNSLGVDSAVPYCKVWKRRANLEDVFASAGPGNVSHKRTRFLEAQLTSLGYMASMWATTYVYFNPL